MEEDKAAITQTSIDLMNEIASISNYRSTIKKHYCNLARRLKLLTPLFEEIRDSKESFSKDTFKSLLSFKEALESARKLLRFGSKGSKIYMVSKKWGKVSENKIGLLGLP
ncbi:U-box domain-containing protein 13-like [Senna tora]|uniref:RING-type E3 ubiquitin transferase n=1 Tax=Senna tora TaxID=362788 RepID=A0A834U2V4_9FABA|nr:U-box domain-containing protein 13-like [Senna tora]